MITEVRSSTQKYCEECRKQNTIEKQRQYVLDYQKRHPKKVCDKQKKWRKENREVINQRNRERYKNDAEYRERRLKTNRKSYRNTKD